MSFFAIGLNEPNFFQVKMRVKDGLRFTIFYQESPPHRYTLFTIQPFITKNIPKNKNKKYCFGIH